MTSNGLIRLHAAGLRLQRQQPRLFSSSAAAAPATTPFVLLAHVKVHKALLDEHMAFAHQIDGIVQETEPGMLYHALDADPADECRFTWTEVYQDDAALLFHFDNPPVIAAMGPETEKFYDGGIDIHIYGEVAEETKAEVRKRGIEISFHSKQLGYSRL